MVSNNYFTTNDYIQIFLTRSAWNYLQFVSLFMLIGEIAAELPLSGESDSNQFRSPADPKINFFIFFNTFLLSSFYNHAKIHHN